MNEYTASNGLHIKITADRRLIVENSDHTYPATIAEGPFIETLREFFRFEEDERFLRWRWPENPDYVVYPREEYVQVLHEPDGTSGLLGSWTRADVQFVTPDGNLMGRAALAYFDAHPEPKPWHNAKPEEVWVVQTDNAPRGSVCKVVVDAHDYASGVGFLSLYDGAVDVGIYATAITAARRIYPEGDS